jgi:alkylation response protein AidB-like acyl-CoA dehydrogenase
VNSAIPEHYLQSTAVDYKKILIDRADEIEKARMLPKDLSDCFAQDGFYRTMIPEAYGGLELSPVINLSIFETLAQGDASAAWCVFIAATSGTMLASIPETAARAIFQSDQTSLSGVFAPMGRADYVDGGFNVNGSWQWGSHSQNADWIGGGCRIFKDGEMELLPSGAPRTHLMLAPAKKVHFSDNWDVSGLSGTGSTDFSMQDVFVPAEHAVGFSVNKPLQRPLYLFPNFGLLALGIAGVAMGTARAAIDELLLLASEKTPQGSARTLANRPATQSQVSEAEALLRSSRSFLYETISEAWDLACSTGRFEVQHRRDLRLATTHATMSCARAVDLMYNLGGGTSVYRTSRLQRMFRDIHVATQHAMVGNSTLELTGRLFLGLETNTSLL